ncbi:MAG: ABC transporter substrate-binding protein [Pseudolabrys sp.]|nr:ABC transporter substrate-binding protein [Pseudolabrys sp.]
MNVHRILRALATMLLLIFVFAASRDAVAQDKSPIRFAAPLALTGPFSSFGAQDRRAIDIAIQEINKAGGINGRPLEPEYADTGGKPDTARSALERFSQQPDILFVWGTSTSAEGLVAAQVAQRNKIVFFTHVAAAPDLTSKGWEWVFRQNPMTIEYNLALQDYLLKVAKPKTIFTVYENSLFGQSSNKAMQLFAEKNGIKYTSEAFEGGSQDFKPVLIKVKAADPDGVFFVAYLLDALVLTRQARELDLKPRFFAAAGAGFIFPEYLKGAGDAATNYFSASLWSPDLPYPGAKQFNEKWAAANEGKPAVYMHASAYSSAYVIADVLKRAKKLDRESIRDAFAATDIKTAYGPVKFGSYELDGTKFTNQNRLETILVQAQGGKWVSVWPPNLATAKPVYPVPGLKQ